MNTLKLTFQPKKDLKRYKHETDVIMLRMIHSDNFSFTFHKRLVLYSIYIFSRLKSMKTKLKKVKYLIVATVLAIGAIFLFSSYSGHLKEGDVVFQISESSQSPAVIFATGSPWSHCGIIVEKPDGLYVLEASRTVRLTPLDKWKKQGKFGIISSRRVVDHPVKIKYKKYLGCPYDLEFRFGNKKWYCSELVYDIYKTQLGIEIGTPRPVKDYNISNKKIRSMMKRRGISETQLVIAPSDIK